MPESKFLKTALRIIRENPEMFEALVEFERTKRIPKFTYRKKVNFTIDETLLRQFKRHCQEKGLNMSRIVEMHMREEVKKIKFRQE